MNQESIYNIGLFLAINSAKWGIENGKISEGDRLKVDRLMDYVVDIRYDVEKISSDRLAHLSKDIPYFSDVIGLVNENHEIKTVDELRRKDNAYLMGISHNLGEIFSQLGHVRDNLAGPIQNESGLVNFLNGFYNVIDKCDRKIARSESKDDD